MSKPYHFDEEGNLYLSMEAILSVLQQCAETMDDIVQAKPEQTYLAPGTYATLGFLTNTFLKIGHLAFHAEEHEKGIGEVTQDMIGEIYDFLKDQ